MREQAACADETILLERLARVVRVARANHAEAVGVPGPAVAQLQAVAVGFPHVAALGLAAKAAGDAVGEDLEVGPLVFRGQERMRVGRTLDLRVLDERLVAAPALDVGTVHG